MAFNEDEAPEGCIAVESDDIDRCDLCVKNPGLSNHCDADCCYYDRVDRCSVYFIARILRGQPRVPPAFRELLK